MNPRETAHYHMLKLIERRSTLSQRELAQELGVSVGKTHYLLKALLDRGLVKMDNFRRCDNKLGYMYVLTPSGIATRLSLAREFLRCKELEYRMLRAEIDQLRLEVASAGNKDAS